MDTLICHDPSMNIQQLAMIAMVFERQNKNISVIFTDFVYNPIPFLLHWVMNAPLGWTKSYQCML
jgi:hypothetical protein